jgi:hypothetical protein
MAALDSFIPPGSIAGGKVIAFKNTGLDTLKLCAFNTSREHTNFSPSTPSLL